MAKKSASEETQEATDREFYAKMLMGGMTNSAVVIAKYSDLDDVDLEPYLKAIKAKATQVHNGDMKTVETMLVSQAAALDNLFAILAMRAQKNMGEYLDAADKYMKLALRAQSQCRATLETLAEVKNPKPYIQNNKAQYQQVNNGVAEPNDKPSSRTGGKNAKPTNELLEHNRHEQQWMDTGAPEEASRDDKELETVGA